MRPAELLELRARLGRGEIGREALDAAEDEAIKDALALQERVGLRLATDGEFRRRSYHSFFYSRLGDIRIDTVGGEDAKGGEPGKRASRRASQPAALINGRVRWTSPINVADFKFIAANSKLVPKITIPGPCALHFRGGDAAVLASAYKDVEAFWEDTITAFGHELAALADAGCRYVQIDETAFAKFGDPEVQVSLRSRGDDWSTLIDKYIAVTNRVLADAPRALRIGMHLCRGNRGGQWHAEGSYDAVAERLFNALDIAFYSSNTILRAPARSRRCGCCRGTRASCSAWSRPRRLRSSARTSSSDGSRTPRAMLMSTALRSAHSAASPASTPAIRFRRRCRSTSSASLSSSRTSSGARGRSPD